MTKKKSSVKLTPIQRKLRILVSSVDIFRLKNQNIDPNDFPVIPKMNEIKFLCQDMEASRRFALFIAKSTVNRVSESNTSKHRTLSHEQKLLHMQLMEKALKLMTDALIEDTFEIQEKIRELRTDVESQQNTFKKVHWNKIRKIIDRNLLIIEEALSCYRSVIPEDARRWAFEAAVDYCDNYCFRPVSEVEKSIKNIVDFWCDFYDYYPQSIISTMVPENT